MERLETNSGDYETKDGKNPHYEGKYENALFEGQGDILSSQSLLFSMDDLVIFFPVNLGVYTFPENKGRYVGEFSRGQFHGKGTFFVPGGSFQVSSNIHFR